MNVLRLVTAGVLAVLAVSAVVACGSSGPAGAEGDAQHTGTLDVALTGTSSNGTTYRLRNGTFTVAGPQAASLSTETNVDAPSIQATLTTGSYTIALQNGWYMERSVPDAGFTPVNASLTSANPTAFSIAKSATTNVAYVFNVDGEPIQLGSGTLDVTVNVNECDAGLSACGSSCVDLATSNANCGACGTVCGAGATCQNGACVGATCPSGYTSCGAGCVDLANDTSNCGACGAQCPQGFSCQSFTCVFGCFAPNLQCPADGGLLACVNPQTDSNNCGSCGHVCPSGTTCVNAFCQ